MRHQTFVPVFVALWLILFLALGIREARVARSAIRNWGTRVGLDVTRFGGGGFRRCPMNAGRATRVYHVFATFGGDQPVRGWVLCRSGGVVLKAVLSPPPTGPLDAAELNSLVNQDLPG